MDRETPESPENPKNVVGIDGGILKYAHDTDGHTIGSVDLSDERDHLKREQRKLSRKDGTRTTTRNSAVALPSATPT